MSMTMALDEDVTVGLRGSLGSSARLLIGDRIEIVLEEQHLRALHAQVEATVRDAALVKAADDVLDEAFHAASQARSAAERAREFSKSALTPVQIASALELARSADRAAQEAQRLVEEAATAMRSADEVAERVLALVTAS
ncbi:hypothetical protein GCM10022243_59110 [Saccharothrix violaceirubra]